MTSNNGQHYIPKKERHSPPYHIVIDLDSCSSASFAFACAFACSKRLTSLRKKDKFSWRFLDNPKQNFAVIRWGLLNEHCSDLSCKEEHAIVSDSILTSLNWACDFSAFYGKRRGRLFCEMIEKKLKPQIESVFENVVNKNYSVNSLPLPPMFYELQQNLISRDFLACNDKDQSGIKEKGFCMADVLAFSYITFFLKEAAKSENKVLQLLLVTDVPQLISWWKRIQTKLQSITHNLKNHDCDHKNHDSHHKNLDSDRKNHTNNDNIPVNSFKCYGVYPLDGALVKWLENDDIKDIFVKQLKVKREKGLIKTFAPKLEKSKEINSILPVKELIASILAKLQSKNINTAFRDAPWCSDIRDVNDAVPWACLPNFLNPLLYKTGALKTEVKGLRKRQQVENMIYWIQKLVKKDGIAVDFCCGSGHVGLVLAFLRPDITVYLLDINPVSIGYAKTRAGELQLKNVSFIIQDVRELSEEINFDVGFALHGCGSATDYALQQCLQRKAAYVFAPCCFGFFKNEKETNLPASKLFCELCITREELINLTRDADNHNKYNDRNFNTNSNNSNNPNPNPNNKYTNPKITTTAITNGNNMKNSSDKIHTSENISMRIINEDRNCLGKEQGYNTFHFSMVPSSCTPKNQIICGYHIL